MTCFTIFLALLIERFFDWSHLRDWQWFFVFEHYVAERLSLLHPYVILTLTCLPILLCVLVLQYLFTGLLYGFAKLVFDLLILLYTFGPKNLWADYFFATVSLPVSEKPQSEIKLTDTSYNKSLHWYSLNNLFIAAYSRVFAIVFWYVVLGAFGAVLYRLISLLTPDMQNSNTNYAVSSAARLVQSILDWLPIRIFTMLFALSGHFVQVIETWRRYMSFGLANNETMLTECGIAALGFADHEKMPEDGTAEKHAESLIERVFMLLIIVAVIGVFLC